MLSENEKKIILYGKTNGRTQAEVEQSLINYRTGYKPPKEAVVENSPIKDVAIGFGKGLAQNIAIAGAQNAGPVGKAMLDNAPAFKENIESFNQSAHATNKMQQVGKALEIGAEVLSPFVVARLAGLAAKVPSVAAKVATSISETGVVGAVKSTVSKVADFAKNPKLALAKKSVDPQLEASANRLFLAGTKRLEDPVATYEKYLTQSKKAITDIKADPAIAEVGNSIGDEFKVVVAQRRAVGKTMGEEIKKVGGIKTDILPANDKFVADLSEEGLSFDKVKRVVVQTASQTKMTAEELDMIANYARALQKLGTKPTIAELDAFMSRIPKELDVYKSSKGITGQTNAARIVKKSLADLREQFDPAKTGNAALKRYADARKAYSDLSDFIDDGISYLGKITQSGDFA